MCVCKATGSLNNRERGLVRVHDASYLFKLNDLLCECVCIFDYPHFCCAALVFELLAFGIQSFLLFFQMKKHRPSFCFSYQPCLGVPIPTPEAKKQFQTLTFNNKIRLDTEHLELFSLLLPFHWGRFENKLRGGQPVQVQLMFCYWHCVSCQVKGSMLVQYKMSFKGIP